MYSLMLLNGGIGTRVGASRPKQFLKIKGIPIIVYSLNVVDKIPEISEIIINYPPNELETVKKIIKDYAVSTTVKFVEAGSSRQESVAKMIQQSSKDHVLLHEAARPIVESEDFYSLIDSEHDNVSLMSEIPFTVAPVDKELQIVTGSLDRTTLRNVQLPQKFLRRDLLDAHIKAETKSQVFTEDATLLASQGYEVHFVNGKDRNIKVTTATDIQIANYLLQAQEDYVDA